MDTSGSGRRHDPPPTRAARSHDADAPSAARVLPDAEPHGSTKGGAAVGAPVEATADASTVSATSPSAGTLQATAALESEEDAWLVRWARTGDLEAFEVLVHRHRDRIYRIAVRTTGSREDAEDVTQDVVIQLWTGLAAFAGTSSFTTWLHRVVINRCFNRLRSRRRSEPLPGPGEPAHPRGAAAGDQVQDREHLAVATRALAQLPPELRSVFVLCQLEGLSYREAAAAHRVTEATVRGRLARARAALIDATREWT